MTQASNITKLHPDLTPSGLNWTSILWLSAMHIGAIAALFYTNVPNVIAASILYFITGCLGITLTFHRLLAHRSLAVPKWL